MESRNFIEQIIDKDLAEGDTILYTPDFHRNRTDIFISDTQRVSY